MSLSYLWAKLCKKIRGKALINSKIHKSSKVESGSHILNSTFGKHSFCGYDCTIVNCDIGSFCSIADSVYIGRARHPIEFVSTSPVFLSHKDSIKIKLSKHEYSFQPRTIIESDVWIGDKALIKAGVRIGVGAVVGMGSVVTRDIMPYTISAGNPARAIRKRFEDKIVNKLLESKWWELSDTELKKIAMQIQEVSKFIREIKK
jgi:acetyltransferase-like isoleucine patch superfamily enzyme